MRFADVDAEGLELDDDSPDRLVFATIELRSEIGDLATDEAWQILAQRYPDDPRIRLAALAEDLSANGLRVGTGGRGWIAGAIEALAAKLADEDRPALAAVIALLFDELRPEDEAIRARIRPVVSAWPRNAGETTHVLGAFVGRLLDEADDRTRGGRPWEEPKQDSPEELASKHGGELRRYSPSEAFARGDRVAHPKFGEGVVLLAAEGKIVVAFGNDRRTLVARV